MSLTRFRSAITILTEDIANSWFGGLFGTPEGEELDPEHPLNAGHVHDGQHEDGHAQKINLDSHVTGQLDGANIQDNSIAETKLNFSVATGYLQIFADEAARLADSTSYLPGDLYGKALQVDTVTEYILTDISPITWTALGGEVATETLKVLGMTNSYPLDPSGGMPITITFAAAPSDILIKQFDVLMMKNIDQNSIPDGLVYGELNVDGAYIENVEINGTPIDATGIGILKVYTKFAEVPVDINIPLNAGDVLSMDLYVHQGSLSGINALYVTQPSTLPSRNYFIGDSSGTIIPFPTAQATATLTVNSAPTDGSEQISFTQRFNVTPSFDVYSTTSVSLSPAGGARTPGQNDYDNTLGTAALIAAEIAAAINDNANDFDSDVGISASALGPVVTLTASLPGPGGNQIIISNDIPEITESGTNFSGGTMPADTVITFPAAPANGTITDIYIQSASSEIVYNPFVILKALKINGGVNQLNSQITADHLFPQQNDRDLDISISIEAGDIITLEMNNPYVPAVVIPTLIVSYD